MEYIILVQISWEPKIQYILDSTWYTEIRIYIELKLEFSIPNSMLVIVKMYGFDIELQLHNSNLILKVNNWNSE